MLGMSQPTVQCMVIWRRRRRQPGSMDCATCGPWTVHTSLSTATTSSTRQTSRATSRKQRFKESTCVVKKQSFQSNESPFSSTNLHFLGPQSDTSLHCKTINTWPVHHAVCLFFPQFLLVLVTSTDGAMAKLSGSGWLVTYSDGLRSYSPFHSFSFDLRF